MKITQLEIENFKYNYAISPCPSSKQPPLFFINGAFQNMHSWAYLSSSLQEDFTIIVADLPGWGSADLLPDKYDFSFLASSVNQILEKENIDQVSLISTSYGSLIATKFTEEYTSKVANLMLCSPLLEISGRLKAYYPELLQIIFNKDASSLNDFLCNVGLLNCPAGHQGKIDHFEKLLPLFKRKISKLKKDELDQFLQNTNRIISYGDTDLSAISGINAKVITGEYDSFTTPDDCHNIAQFFSKSCYESIPRADHMFLFEQPQAFANVIARFLGHFSQVKERLVRA